MKVNRINSIRSSAWLGISTTILATILAGCGGGGGGAANTTLTGTAATGAPIVGQVVAIDANGQQFSATTSATGAYTVNVAGGTAPFILTVVGTSGGRAVTLTSVATASGQTVNITPLTDLIVSTAAGQPGGATLATLCTSTVPADKALCKTALTAAATPAKLDAAVTAVTSMIAPLNTTNINPLNGAFTANGTGLDAVLDAILVTPAASQGAMATVTLIAVPGAAGNLGTVTLPPQPGGTASTAPITPAGANVTAAINANTVLAEIRACTASMNALYPANMTAAPTAQQLDPFVDASFSMGGQITRAAFITKGTTLGSAGGFAAPGLSLPILGLSQFSSTQQANAAAVVITSSPVSASPAVIGTTAWVKMDAEAAGGGQMDFKVVKNAAYTGCPGGWKVAGSGHITPHMNARIVKSNFGSIQYTSERAFHLNTNNAVAESISSIVVSGPGLRVYAPATATGVGAAAPITLVTPSPSTGSVTMTIQGNNMEAINSCQYLLANQTLFPATTGTPCYDETAVAPGAVYVWEVHGGYNNNPALNAAPGAGPVMYAFPFQISAAPLARAFVLANAANLFPQSITATPQGTAALNSAAAGFATNAALDGVIRFNYTQSAVYGALINHCGIGVTDAGNATTLQAEISAVGQQTSCTFTTGGLNSSLNGLLKPAAPFGGAASYMLVSNKVLGNAAVSMQPY